MELKVIAHVKTDFPAKFGIPRQSGLADTKGEIIFEKEYANQDAFKGIEEYSHLWILWGFSECEKKRWKPTVRPPRLGGNERRGVFATRSPFRPNPIGLSCVKLEQIEYEKNAEVILKVSGTDMMDGTPIYDIKPYLPYVDAKADAKGGFAEEKKNDYLEVEIPDEWMSKLSDEQAKVLKQVLRQDPRPSYQDDPERIYGMEYADFDIRFKVCDKRLIVCQICDRAK